MAAIHKVSILNVCVKYKLSDFLFSRVNECEKLNGISIDTIRDVTKLENIWIRRMRMLLVVVKECQDSLV